MQHKRKIIRPQLLKDARIVLFRLVNNLFFPFFQEDFHGFNDEELATFAQNTKENLEILQEDFHGFHDEELKIFRQKTEQSLKLINQAIKRAGSRFSPVRGLKADKVNLLFNQILFHVLFRHNSQYQKRSKNNFKFAHYFRVGKRRKVRKASLMNNKSQLLHPTFPKC